MSNVTEDEGTVGPLSLPAASLKKNFIGKIIKASEEVKDVLM